MMQEKNIYEQQPEFSFRQATEEDFDFIFQLNKTNMKKYVDEIRGWNDETEKIHMKKNFSPESNKIIQVENKDAGVLSVVDGNTLILLDHIELLPEFQGKGIGEKIIKELLDRGKPVRLQVLKQNPAFKLYKRLGFKVIGETDLKYQMRAEKK